MKVKMLVLAGLCALATGHSLYGQGMKTAKSSEGIAGIKSKADAVKIKAEKLVQNGFTAGDGYGEVWIRDLNTFVTVASKMNDKELIKKHLLTFFQFQQPDGGILDGYVPVKKGAVPYNYYYSALAPDYAGHKNTVETDQETSLIQAVAKYIRSTGDKSILKEMVGGLSVKEGLERAMN